MNARVALNRLYRNPDECAVIDHGPGRTSCVRVADDLTIEVVEHVGCAVGERYTVQEHYANMLINTGSVEFRPVSHFQATCNPSDRPAV